MSPSQPMTFGIGTIMAWCSPNAAPRVSCGQRQQRSARLLLALFLSVFSVGALADSFNVSDFELSPTAGPNDPGSPQECVIDGPGAIANDGRTFSPDDQLSIDRSCTVRNFTCDNPLGSTLNFASHVPGTLIIFENVCYDGNFACANVDGSAYIWAVNGSDFSSVKEGCQDLIIPVEKIEKSAEDLNGNAITSVSVGVPFRYTLDVPVMFNPVDGTVIPGYGSPNELGNIVITDDMTPGTLGVELLLTNGLASITVERDNGGTLVQGSDYTVTSSAGSPNVPGVLTFEILNPALLPAFEQLHISIEVMLEDSALNTIGKLFTNVAEWSFSRYISGTLYDPLPGQNGIAQLLSISEPDLLVNKTTGSSAVNFSDMPAYSIFVQNVGGAPAWNIEVEDMIPLGMRDFDPTTSLTVTLAGALLDPADYTLNYATTGPNAGLLTVTLADSAGALAPNAILRIDYTSQLDQPGGSNEPNNGDVLTNVAAATTWYNDISTNLDRVEYIGPRGNGTVGTDDNQDAAEITAALSGYYFEKTVSNVTTGVSPASTAIPGDRLRYRVRLFNLDQEIYNVHITDQLDDSRLAVATASFDPATCPAGATCTIDNGTGLVTISGDIDVAPSSSLQSIAVEFEVDVLSSLPDGDLVSNQAQLSAEDLDSGGNPITADSDDPNVNGVVNQADPLAPASDATDITIVAPGPLLKANPAGLTETPVGEVFEYTLTVPQTPVAAPLYDVQVQDALPAALEPTTMLATATIIDSTGTPTGTTYTLTVTDTGSGLALYENVVGLDLGANERAQITLEVQVANTLANQDGVTYSNTATYTYSRINGGTQSDPAGTESTTPALTIVEPALTATKSVINLDGNSPAQGGDTLEYTVTLNSGGSSTAFDTSIVDTLPAGLDYLAGSAEITLGASTTQVEPDIAGSTLTWGHQVGDESLDIPVGDDLVLTYQVVITSATNGDLINLAEITWHSQDGSVDGERTGADAPDAAGLNNYFTSASATQSYQDTTAFAKTVQADSWDDGGVLSNATDGILRVGDTVTYALTLSLREGLTEAATVADTLPTGLELVSFSYSNGPNISFTPVTEPAANARGTLNWDLGDITNTPDADASNDDLVINVVAEVLANDTDTLTQLNTQLVNNSAELNYTGAAAPLPGAVDITLNQPVMSAITKADTAGGRTGSGISGDPYQVDLAADTMNFRLETCNNGDAPAYNVEISDTLANQLDEADLATAPTVTLGGNPLTVTTDFAYTAPARGGAFTLVLNDGVAVDPAECLVVTYDVGFHTDVTTTTEFSNGASLDRYWSLDASSGQEYLLSSIAAVYMINASAQPVPVKTLVGQADGEAVIGETVIYTIVVPADNITRSNVIVSDTLAAELALDGATLSINGGAASPITSSGLGQDLQFAIGTLQAGDEALITLTTHVANNADSNDTDVVSNSASYSYDGLATPLDSLPAASFTIVEPLLTIGKTVENTSNPGNPAAGGNVLEYTVTLENTGSSTAFDTTVTDTLPAGLTFLGNATATIGGPVAGFNATPTVNGSDLVWGSGNSDGSLDVPAGATLVLTYQATLTDVSQGTYDNNVYADWTSLDSSDPRERIGDNCPAPSDFNDYCTTTATATVTSTDTTAFAKTVVSDSWDDSYSSAADATLRAGDTVTYALTLNLREGLTSGVTVTDTLPAGVELVSFNYVTGGNLSVTPSAEPNPGDSGTLSWVLGDINNTPDGVSDGNDVLVIEVEARVLASGIAQAVSTTLNNSAVMSYDTAASLNSNVDITVLQPVLSQITKEDPAGNSYPAGSPLVVDIVNDTLSYVLETCNAAGAAPAYNLQLVDTLQPELDETSIANLMVTVNGAAQSIGSGYSYVLAPGGGAGNSTMTFDLLVPVEAGACATVTYDVGFRSTVAPNSTWSNSVLANDYWSLPTPTTDGKQYSPATPAEFWMTNAGADPLPVKTLVSPASQVTIGEAVQYQITIPAISALRDNVVVSDTLDPALVFDDDATLSVGGAPAVPIANSGAGQNLQFNVGALPANENAVITLNAHVVNDAGTNAAGTFRNEASYTYTGLASPLVSAPSALLTIVEPLLTIGKTVENTSNPGNPAAGGDVLEYTVTLVNTGSSTAFDTTVTDALPAGLTLVTGSATATIAGNPVAGFNATPTVNGSDLIWGAGNGDETLDVPATQTLVLTYQATMTDASLGTYDNNVYADWSSLDSSDPLERFGDNCPAPSDFNDYCTAIATASVASTDTTAFAKTVLSDSWDDSYSSAADATLRAGDTVTYALTLSLREGLTSGVMVTDTLPAGVELVSFNYVIGGNLSVTPGAEPNPGDSGTLTWTLGDINNTPDGAANSDDDLVIQVEARVLNSITQAVSTSLNNAATVNYDSTESQSSNVDITVLQPVLSQITKEDPAGNSYPAGSPLVVDIVNDTLSYVLETCNAAGAAPAYNLQLVDTLQPELDENTINNLVVTVNGVAGAAHNYNLVAGGGSGDSTMTFDLLVPVEAGRCATITYDVGFRPTVAPNSTWSNSVAANDYWSLPTPTTAGKQYSPATPAEFWMTNTVTDPLPLKEVLLPVAPDTEVTIGEAVQYQITVPAISGARNAVIVTDTLSDDLVFDSATLSVAGAAAAPVPNSGSGQDLQFNVGDLLAGEDAVITLFVHVVNTVDSNATDTIANTATYTYTGLAAPLTSDPAVTLTIVEPLLTLAKVVENTSNPGSPAAGGDVLEYTVTLVNTGAATAFDTTVTDTMPTGLALVAGSTTATIAGNPVAGFNGTPTANGNDLIWGAGNSDETLDVPAGDTLVLSYQVTVGAASGALVNSVLADWTSLDSSDPLERTGTGCPAFTAPDDYCVGPVSASIDTAADIDITKTVFNVTTGLVGDNASPGDVLEYTITVSNRNSISIPDFTLLDDPGSWNAEVVFLAGSMTTPTVVGSTYNDFSNANGGTNGTGLVDLRNLTLGAAGSGTDTVTVTFQLTLAAAIDNGTVVANRSVLEVNGSPVAPFDPALGLAETTIASAPLLRVRKVSVDRTDDADVLMPGDTLRYIITVANLGNEDVVNVTLRDAIPQYTRYVAGSTRLNGNAVADPAAGVSAIEAGMLVKAPAGTAAGEIPADAAAPNNHVATIRFDVVIDSDAIGGTLIENQGFVNGSGAGGTAFAEQPTDDPATAVADDPTVDIIGALPLLDVQKTVALDSDPNGNSSPDTGETLLYTFVVTNTSATPATDLVLTDVIPPGTDYILNRTTLNGSAVADSGGSSPLVAGLAVNSTGEASGTMAGNSTATVTFRASITAGVNTVISNQGTLSSNELPDEPSDEDGIDANGDQPTEITVGQAQQMSIVKDVAVVGGGVLQAGSELEYTIQVTNSGSVAATQVVITDDLSWVAAVGSFVSGSARLNGSTAGITEGTTLLAEYSDIYGDLAVGDTATLRFRVQLNNAVSEGTVISNTAVVSWDNGNQDASSTVDITVGAIPGTGTLSGRLWHDADLDGAFGTAETVLADWTVEAYRDGTLLRTTTSDNNGQYSLVGLPEPRPGESYEVRFIAPGATATTASLGYGDSNGLFTDGPQRIRDITFAADGLVTDLNLPITPNGVVYNAVSRSPIEGAVLTMVDSAGAQLATSCFEDPAQQGQVTHSSGFYKFDLNFSGGSCQSSADYRIVVTPPGSGYEPGVSRIIAPLTSESTAAYDVPVCSADAVASTPLCEAQSSASQPPLSVDAASPLAGYYLNLMFSNGAIPDDSQIFNNHIPLDPVLDGAVNITKTAAVLNASRGEFVPYTIRITNNYGQAIPDLAIVDSFPPGFKYVEGSARLDDQPVTLNLEGRQLVYPDLDLDVGAQHTLKMLFIVGAGVGEGEYVNRVQVFSARTARINFNGARSVSDEASATVRVVPDPDFDCTDVIGKIYDDANMNGYQDDGEAGLPNVRAVTARGLIVTSDEYGRFHITCAVVPNELRGSNFILKVDERSLPSGYRMTTENPLVRRATRGKMIKFNFGAALHRVVRLDIADAVFEPGTSDMRLQWKSRLPLLMEQLQDGPSILRLAYMGENEKESLVDKRLKAMKKMITEKWAEMGNPYELVIETEVFWRTGAPLKGGSK